MLSYELCYEESEQPHIGSGWGDPGVEHVGDPVQMWVNVVNKHADSAHGEASAALEPLLKGYPRLVRSRTRRVADGRNSVLRARLDKANQHFRRKATAVIRDKDAVILLAALYKQSNMRVQDFDTCTLGIPLAKLAAANFCDIGSQSIYITMAGREFIESVAES